MRKFILSLAAFVICICAAAQYIPDSQDYRVGKLDNGMTYYLYHNENPVGCADFFIAHNVGALQEEDNQNGLAHFLEHMAFNGTKHYPGKGLLDFLADEGVRFGYNVNAYTSQNETVYNISNVPLVRESFIDSVLMVLHDWSCDISCEQGALDEERGVISEEWRLRDEPRYRMMCRQNELVYKGGKQPNRTVIGSLDVINGFKREEILDFYDKWYRPDLQAIIIVGDFNVDEMETRVREKFSDITMPQNPPQKPESYLPPKFDGPLFGNQTDPTVKFKVAKIIYRQAFPSKEMIHTEDYYRDYFSRQIVTSIVSDRIKERAHEAGSRISSAVFVTSPSHVDFYTSLFTVTPRDDDALEAGFTYPLEEVRRLLLHGFSVEEFESAKASASIRAHLDKDLHRADVTNTNMVKTCINHFLRNYPLIDPVELLSIQKKALADLTFEEVAKYPEIMFKDSEIIYSNCLNIKDLSYAVPEGRVLAIADSINALTLEPKFMEYSKLDLSIDSAPGTIKSRKTFSSHDIQEWTLSNGVKVFYRKSAPVNSDSHLSMNVTFDTGRQVYPEGQIAAGDFACSLCRRYAGFRGCDRPSQKNYSELSGMSLILDMADVTSGFTVIARADRVETAFKVLNLQITDPELPSDKIISKSAATSLKNLAKEKNPKELYSEYKEDRYYGPNPWNVRLDSAAVNAVDRKFVEDLYRNAFCDVSTMRVYICSDEPQENIEEYLCKYVASLPVNAPVKKHKAHPLHQNFKGRNEISRVNPPVSAPVCDIDYYFSKRLKKDTKTRLKIAILDYIMSARYLALIREERGGAYHVGFSTDIFSIPSRPVLSSVSFQTRPELKDILLKDVEEEMERMCATGPADAEMEVAVKYFIKRHNEDVSRTSNSVIHQLNQMSEYVKYGIDYDYDFEAIIKSITAKDIQALAERIASGDRLISTYIEE